MRYLAGFGTGVSYGVHCNNLQNLARGIVERVFYVSIDGRLARPPRPIEGAYKRLSGVRKRLLKVLHSTPVVSRDEYPMLYTGRKRAIYERARESLTVRAVNSRDAWVSTFIKAEKVNFTLKFDPAPRTIQPRSPRFNLELGRYLKLFEKELCRAFERVFGYPVVLKGCNAQQVGSWMHVHWTAFKAPVAIGLDASRFDQHVSKEALQWEHSVYNAVFNSPELRRLLSWQLHNHGIAYVGEYRVEYDIEGCRMSGDINTGMGNCLIMACIVIAFCEHVGIEFRLANNGDDCVLFIEQEDLAKLSGISQWFLEMGFTLTMENPVYVLEEVVFCQAQPVLTSTGYRMVRDPRTAMSKDCVSMLSWATETEFQYWCHAIGACGLSLTRGIPVWEAWYRRLIELGSEAPDGVRDQVYDSGLGYMSRGVVGGEVTAECRVSFWRAFGILPDLQMALEAEYSAPVVLGDACPMTYPCVQAIDQAVNPLATWLKQTLARR